MDNKSFWSKIALPAGVVAVILIVALVAMILKFPTPLLKAPTVYASFDMEATIQDSTGIECYSTFILEASEDLDEDVIAAVLQVEPVVEFDVEKTASATYEIKPKEDLTGDKIYRFAIRSEEHRYSWAYQVKDQFKVKGTLPADQGTSVPVDTGIEINFSHENYEDFEKYFSISPKVDGRFEYHRKTAVFVPKNELDEATVYKVKIDGRLPLKDSDQTLVDDYVFEFETNYSSDENLYDGTQFRNSFYEVGTNQAIALRVYDYGSDTESDITEVDVYKFKSVDEYIETWEARQEIPSWCYWSKNLYKFDVDNLDYVATLEAESGEINYLNYIYFPSADLEEGQYMFVINNSKYNNQAMVQITDLSAHISVTATDTLVWVNDVNLGEPAYGASVELYRLDRQYPINKEGIAIFETPEGYKNSWNEQENYLLHITNKNQDLITEISPVDYHNISDDYWHALYTDRPMYKPYDKVQYWGFIEPKGNSTVKPHIKMRLMKDWNTLVDEYLVNIDENDTYFGEIELGGLLPGSYNFEVIVDDEVLEYRYFEVKNYVKPAYNLTIDAGNNAVFAGEDINFNISTQFFEGTPVPNLSLRYETSDSKDQFIETDKNGEASVRIKAKSIDCTDYYCNDSRALYFNADATLGEETDKVRGDKTVRVFRSHVTVDLDNSVEDDVATVNLNTYNVDLSNINSGTNSYYDDYKGASAGNIKITGKITELSWDKKENGEYYDFVNKKSVKTYSYSRIENHYDDFEVLTDSKGVGVYEFTIDPDKQYRVEVQAYDEQGLSSHKYTLVYGGSSYDNTYDYYSLQLDGGRQEAYQNVFDVGDNGKVTISKNSVPLAEDTSGKYLFSELSRGLNKYSIEDKPSYEFTFAKNDIPNMYVGAVWFDGTGYQTVYSTEVYFDTNTKELNVEVDPDKDEYAPGDEVTLNINVEDVNGDGVAAEVNLNLVDEAFYKLVYDFFDNPLSEIYARVNDGVFDTYDTHENPLNEREVDGGKGGCFVAGTQILMADGNSKNIEDIVVGDYVLTREGYTSQRLVPGKVLKTFEEEVSEYIVVNNNLEVTTEHVVFLNGRWQLSSKMSIGDFLMDTEGNEVEILSMSVVRRPVVVYNFEVENYHTYFANGFYVHNDKGGDYIRNEFEDVALFKTVSTGANGKAEVTFTLPDNITSWRVTARAIDTDDLQAGSAVSAVPVTLPVFGDLVMNNEFSVKDSPVIKMRAYGDALKAGDSVAFNVAGDWFEKKSSEIEGKAFESSYYQLPPFEKGKHEVTLFAKSGKYEDALAEEINVVGSRLTHNAVEIVTEVKDSKKLPVSEDEPTEVIFVDAGRGLYFWDLWRLYYSDGDRLDQKLSQVAASDMAKKYFDLNWGLTNNFDASEYQAPLGGLKLLPYADPSLSLSALTLLADPNPSRYSEVDLREYFYTFFLNKDSNLDDVVLSMLGLASLNEPVLTSLRVIQQEETLSVDEMLYIALAFEKLGADDDAIAIYEKIKGELGGSKKSYETALGAMLAAGLGDKDAILLWDDVDFHGIEDDIVNLYYIGFLDNYFENVGSEKAKFKVKFGDQVADVDLAEEYGTFGVYAKPGDTVRATELEGDLAAVLYYSEEVEPEDFEVDNDVSIKRTYFVDGEETTKFKEGDIITVRLDVSTKSDVASSSYRITDILPSGLTPLTRGYQYYAGYGDADYYNYPYYSDGQEIRFYWHNGFSPKFVQYQARVVNPGKFYADPVKLESFYDDTVVNISDGDYVEIEEGV